MELDASQSVSPAAAGMAYAHRWKVLAVVLAAEVLDLLDATVVNVAAPSIRKGLGGAASTVQWVAAGYTLAFGVLLVIGGRLGDRWGRRTSFLVGATGFTIASVVCAAAVDPPMLIASRVAQGALGALLLPQGLGILKSVFPAEELGRAFSAFGPVMGLSAVGGPILAGALIDLDAFGSGWRLIFLINLPLGLVAVAGAARWIPRDRGDPTVHIDAVSGLVLGAALAAIVHPLIQGPDAGWPRWTWVSMAAGLVLGGVFVRRELTADQPLIAGTLLRNRVFGSGLLLVLVFFAGMSGLMLTISLFIQGALGFSPLRAGLGLAPMALGIAIGSVALFPLVPRLGRRLILFGLLVNAAGAGYLAEVVHQQGRATDATDLILPLFVGGVGMAGVFAPLFDVIIAGVTEEESGSASGVLTAVQQIAGAVGVAAVATLFLDLAGTRDPAAAMAISAAAVAGFTVLGSGLVALLPARARTAQPQ